MQGLEEISDKFSLSNGNIIHEMDAKDFVSENYKLADGHTKMIYMNMPY